MDHSIGTTGWLLMIKEGTMIEVEEEQHSYQSPQYIDERQTKFLNHFCRERNLELLSVLGEEYDFINYKVSYNNSTQYTLLHYHTESEEHIYLNYVVYYNG